MSAETIFSFPASQSTPGSAQLTLAHGTASFGEYIFFANMENKYFSWWEKDIGF